MQDLRDGVLVDLTSEEVAERLALAVDEVARRNKTSALTELRLKDRVVNRCAERAVEVPEDWAAYAVELRLILASGDELPPRPEFPSGT